MTLLAMLPHRLGVLALAGALVLPVAAAELEGTPVPLDESSAVEVQHNPPPAVPEHPEPPAPEIAPAAPGADQNPLWLKEHEQQVREIEQDARRHEQAMRDHPHWQRDLDKGLQQAFEDKDEDIPTMIALLSFFGMVAAIIVLCSPWIMLIIYLVLRHKARVRHQQDLNNNIDKLLAAGRDIPVELLRGDEPKGPDDSGNLAKGIRHICLGTGWFVFLTIAFAVEIGALGFIWIALGISQVLIWFLNKPAENGLAEQQAGQQD